MRLPDNTSFKDHLTVAEYPKLVTKPKVKRGRSQLEINLKGQIKYAKLPEPVEEYRFLKGRQYRFDFAYPELKIAIEVEGGTWSNGRHTRGSGFQNDCTKYNLAALNGWRVLRFTTNDIESGNALNVIEKALEAER